MIYDLPLSKPLDEQWDAAPVSKGVGKKLG